MEGNFRASEELEGLRDEFCNSSFRRGYGSFKGFVLPEVFGKFQEEIENFEVFDDDVWVTSFPKCGTTWLQETVWCLANNLDFEKAKTDLDIRFPFLEFCMIYDLNKSKIQADCVLKSIEFARNSQRPRFIKSHLPFDLLPKQIRNSQRKPKIFHVARNPKDVCVSYFHHVRFLEHYTGDFETHWQLFYSGKLGYCPFSEVILSYWNRKSEANIHFVKFEDMKSNLRSVIAEIAKFLNVHLSEEQISKLLKHLSFEAMKDNPAVNHTTVVQFLHANDICFNKEGKFIREGSTGTRQKEMTPEINQLFDQWLVKFADQGLRFNPETT